jgi:large subunit ribosomal protein L23
MNMKASDINDIKFIEKPLFSEKSVRANENSVFVFRVSRAANKISIKNAIEKLYGVNVVAVRTSVTHPKSKSFRNAPGKRKALKKAYVSLQKGQMIDVSQTRI